MHLPHTLSWLQIDLERDWANLALHRDMWRGVVSRSFEQCFILFSSFPFLLAFIVGGLGFEFCVFVAGWRHALRSEWPFIIIIIMGQQSQGPSSFQPKSFHNSRSSASFGQSRRRSSCSRGPRALRSCMAPSFHV